MTATTDAARLARAAEVLAELAEAWPRDVLRRAEAFLVATEEPVIKPQGPGRTRHR
jgi:hypothetical protein